MFIKQSALTYAEYLESEQVSSIKYEFVNSQKFAIARIDANHNLIVCNLVVALHLRLRVTSYRLFALDMQLTLASANNAYYPDVMVVGDRTDNDPYVKQKPCLIVEVLSRLNKALDRREKLFNYQKLESVARICDGFAV